MKNKIEIDYLTAYRQKKKKRLKQNNLQLISLMN